jgi:hypothetical protein
LTDRAPGPLHRRLAWFVMLWASGVATVAAIGWLIRLWIG